MYIWDEDNLAAIGRNGVEAHEVEETRNDLDWCIVGMYDTRTMYIARISQERTLFVVVEYTRNGQRPVTARPASDKEQQLYENRDCLRA